MIRSHPWRTLAGTILLGAVLTFPWWQWDMNPVTAPPAFFSTTDLAEAPEIGALRPLPATVALSEPKVALGERLFHDTRLSKDRTIACASCHDLSKGGTDQAYRSKGINGTMGGINTPTVFNSRWSFRQFWDGRAATLEDQIDGPMQHPAEMGSSWAEVVTTVSADPIYRRAFATLYPAGIQTETIKDAIATYERSLITPDSRFDRFLRGDRTALTPEEQQGYRLFTTYGCVSCHQGVNLGGNLYQKLGIVGDYFEDQAHQHRTHAEALGLPVHDHMNHPHQVKVPTLRNIALTPPYFHDGSAATLEDAVQIMSRYQLGRLLPDDDIRHLVAFLRTLTGTYRGVPL